MTRVHSLASASLLVSLVSLVACASPSASPTDEADVSAGEATSLGTSLEGHASIGLRADLAAALGKSGASAEDATVSGVLSVRADVDSETVVLFTPSWDFGKSPDADGIDFVFPSELDRSATGPAKTLFEAMTSAHVTHQVTIVGENVTRTSPKGLVACTSVSSFHAGESGYGCAIKGITGLSQARAAR